jgi:hypothetical protein
MTRRDWWIGIGVVTVALFFHAVLPRYEVVATTSGGYARFDRWTGQLDVIAPEGQPPAWFTVNGRPPDFSR